MRFSETSSMVVGNRMRIIFIKFVFLSIKFTADIPILLVQLKTECMRTCRFLSIYIKIFKIPACAISLGETN